MKKILLPVDFTDVSLNALKFAFVAFGHDCEFNIFHVSDGNLDINDPIIMTLSLDRVDGIKQSLDEMIQHVLEEVNLEIKFETTVTHGGIVDMIEEECQKEEYNAILMGTRDKYNLLDRLFGTISLGVVKRTPIPVYLIPRNSEPRKIDKVLIAADQHLKSDRTVKSLIEWNEGHNADLHFVHVQEPGEKDIDFVENIIEELFEKRNLPYSFSFERIKSKRVIKELNAYGEKIDADMFIFITDRASWLETMTSSSVSRNMILHSQRPILFIHSGIEKRTRIFFDFWTIEF